MNLPHTRTGKRLCATKVRNIDNNVAQPPLNTK